MGCQHIWPLSEKGILWGDSGGPPTLFQTQSHGEITKWKTEEDNLKEIYVFKESQKRKRGRAKGRRGIRFRKRERKNVGGKRQSRMGLKEKEMGREGMREREREEGERTGCWRKEHSKRDSEERDRGGRKRQRQRETSRMRQRQRQRERESKIHTEGKRWRRSLPQTGQGTEN